ncbi:MAG: response regulator [Planctomycetota bacterium]|nr:response regulator [Planctomycetota bacterium]
MKNSLLIIDDSPFLHPLVRAHLETESIKIHSAHGGKDGVQAAVELRPDLILLDVDMPDLDGFNICQQLKENVATKDLTIIFLTAADTTHNKVLGLNLGATDYITKPFKPEEMRARVRAALRSKQHADKRSMTDGLTGLWSETYFDIHLPRKLSLARRTNRPLSCIIGNIDEMGNINKVHGTEARDEVVRAMSNIFSAHWREEDVACYLKNGNYIALMSNTDRQAAVQLAECTRSEIERRFKQRGGTDFGVTCSFGVADTETGDGASLIDRADEALFCAKQWGGNNVSIGDPSISQICSVAS